MPNYRFFKGKPVKRMWRDGRRIKVLLLSPVSGERGETLSVTQEEWDQHGEWRAVVSTRRADLRNFA